MDDRANEKKERLLSALDKGTVMVHLDARRPGVLVPENFKEEAHLRLNLSYHFDPPDLSVGEWGVRATLTFSGQKFKVALPWSCLFAMTSQETREFWLFPDDIPPEILAQTQVTSKVPVAPAKPADPKTVLRQVPGGLPPEPAEPSEPPPDEPPTPPARGHLRLVK